MPSAPSIGKTSNTKNTEEENLEPFAKIDEVMPKSPAEKSGLKIGDKLLKFGSVKYRNHRNLQAIPDVVINNLNNKVIVVVKREGMSENVILNLIPQIWDGKGYLGYIFSIIFCFNRCHLIPL